MAFNIRQFAKNALLTAQKHIDSALDIREEDEDSLDTDDKTMRIKLEKELEIDSGSEQLSHFDDAEIHDTDNTDLQNFGFLDVDLNSETSKFMDGHSPNTSLSNRNTDWGADRHPSDRQTVVDTEPNPIRDAHDLSNEIFHYSPSSNSPDEDSSQNGHSSTATTSIPIIDLSIVPIDSSKESEAGSVKELELGLNRGASEKTLDRFDDMRTAASSDIEVLRQMDDWSIASNSTSYPLKLNSCLKEVMQNSDIVYQTESPQQDLANQVALLIGKLRHKDQRIEELGRLIESLKASNANLLSKNKHINATRTTIETKLQKQLEEKVRELENLMEEGKKLSEHSGRQSKEIRKLKNQLTQLEVVQVARDSALKELQEAHLKINEQEKTIDNFEDENDRLEDDLKKARDELRTAQSGAENAKKCVSEQATKIDHLNAENKRLDTALKLANREKEETEQRNTALSAKLMNKTAHETVVDERERGITEDLQMEKARNATLVARIQELEQRLDGLQNSQRDIAVEIQNANAPLIANIAILEEKVFNFERQNESLGRQLRSTSEQLANQKRKFEETIELTTRNLDEERQANREMTDQLAKFSSERMEQISKFSRLEEQLASCDQVHADRMERLEKQLRTLSNELVAKRNEFSRLQQEHRDLQKRLSERTTIATEPAIPLLVPVQERSRVSPLPLQSEQKSQVVLNNATSDDRLSIKAFRPQRHSQVSESSAQEISGSVGTVLALPGHIAAQDYTIDVGAAEHLRLQLDEAQNQLFQLHKRFDNLLEMHGGCLESIEELKMDNEDLRNIVKNQSIQLSELKVAPTSSTSKIDVSEDDWVD